MVSKTSGAWVNEGMTDQTVRARHKSVESTARLVIENRLISLPDCLLTSPLSMRQFLVLSSLGGYIIFMTKPHIHASHPAIIARLKRADGHLRAVIDMVETGKPCLEIAQQLQAVEKAIANAKRALIHDHMDHCLDGEQDTGDRQELKTIARFL